MGDSARAIRAAIIYDAPYNKNMSNEEWLSPITQPVGSGMHPQGSSFSLSILYRFIVPCRQYVTNSGG